MLLSFDDVSKKIAGGALLHVAGTEALLRKLPRGNWIGGSIEHFMTEDGGKITDERLFVTVFPYSEFSFKTYDVETIRHVAADAYENGFSLVIIPFNTPLHRLYAEKAPGFEQMFIKNVGGWIAGTNPDRPGQTPISVNGLTGEVHVDKAAVMHVGVPDDKVVTIGVINIFSQDEESPIIEFPDAEEGSFIAEKCLINGEETILADYIEKNGLDTKLPLVGDYSGNGVNVSFNRIEDGVVHFYCPLFRGIKYRIAKKIQDYAEEFKSHISEFSDVRPVFSCNCILNFQYGELEGKKIEAFCGPITFGEIAYQLVSQTLVYVSVCDL